MRPSLDAYMMLLAYVAASRTTCVRRGVGCVLADSRGRILAVGYNGVASGLPHCNEGHFCSGHDLPPGRDCCEAVHAEQNALLQCTRPDDIAAAYVTLSPCLACTKLLANTGCLRVVYLEEHSVSAAAKELWLKSRPGRSWELLDEDPRNTGWADETATKTQEAT